MRKPLILGFCLLAGVGAAMADVTKISVTNVDRIVTADFLGDKSVKFVPAAQIADMGILTGQIKKIKLHTHELEDHIVYVVRGKANARLGDEQREVGPGDLIAIPKRVPHRFDQIGSEPFVVLVNAPAPGWDPLKDTKFLE